MKEMREILLCNNKVQKIVDWNTSLHVIRYILWKFFSCKTSELERDMLHYG